MLDRLDADIKAALLAGQKEKSRALKFIKSSLLMAQKDLGSNLTEVQEIDILRKELKKRLEAAELFEKGGKIEDANKEKSEADIIRSYLPPELDEQTIIEKVREIIKNQNLPLENSSMGKIIGLTKQEFGTSADASVIARIVNQVIRES